MRQPLILWVERWWSMQFVQYLPDWVGTVHRSSVSCVIAVRYRWTGKVALTEVMPASVWRGLSRVDKRHEVVMALKKAETLLGLKGGNPEIDPLFTSRFPTLSEYLSAGCYDDGEERERSTVMLFAGDVRGFKAVLNDRSNGRSLWATGDSVDKLFAALEAMLNDVRAPWQPCGLASRKKGK